MSTFKKTKEECQKCAKCCDKKHQHIGCNFEAGLYCACPCHTPIPQPEEKWKGGGADEVSDRLTPPKAKEESINHMVRDFCSVIPRPKSEVRRRIEALLLQKEKEVRAEMVERASEIIDGINREGTFLIRSQAKEAIITLLSKGGE